MNANLTARDITTQSGDMLDNLQILVLDDSEIDLQRMRRAIKKIGPHIIVSTSQSIDEFKQKLDQRKYDLCVFDHYLAWGETGADALGVMKAHERNALTPAVLVSGTSDTEAISKSLSAGFSCYLNKDDLTVERLKAIMANALKTANIRDRETIDSEIVKRILDAVIDCYSDGSRKQLSEIFKCLEFIRQTLLVDRTLTTDSIDDIEQRCFEALCPAQPSAKDQTTTPASQSADPAVEADEAPIAQRSSRLQVSQLFQLFLGRPLAQWRDS